MSVLGKYYFDTVTKTMVKKGGKTWIIYGQILMILYQCI